MDKLEQKAREAFERVNDGLPPRDASGAYMDHMTEGMWHCFKAGYLLAHASPWIPCAERLPTEAENPVLVATEQRDVFEASLYDADWVYDSGIMERGSVTHWMPMPEPPEVEA